MASYGDKHFMVDDELIERIVEYARVGSDDVVLEVGAGYGNLTRALAEKAGKVFAVEKDPRLFEQLDEEVGSLDNVELLHADATKITLPAANKIVSNLPYSISRKITLRFLEAGFDFAVLVYQREFADKLLARSGGDNYRFISVLVQSTADVRVLERVPPEAFDPQPSVWSAVVEVTPTRVLDGRYSTFVKRLFSQKNKKLRNILDNVPEDLVGARPKSLTPQQILFLYNKTR